MSRSSCQSAWQPHRPTDRLTTTQVPVLSSSRRTNGGPVRKSCTSETRDIRPAPIPPPERRGKDRACGPRRVDHHHGSADAGECARDGRGRSARNARLRAVPVVEAQSRHPAARAQSARRAELPAVQSTRTTLRQPEGAPGGDGGAQSGNVPAGAGRRSRPVSHLLFGLSLQDALTPRRRAWISSPSTNPARARHLLEESGYSGTPIVLLQPTDVAISAKLPVVAAQLLRQAGFIVDMQPMNWQSLVVAAGAEDRLAHLHHEFTGRVPGGSDRQLLAQRRLRQGVVWLAVRPGTREAA